MPLSHRNGRGVGEGSPMLYLFNPACAEPGCPHL